MGGACSPFIHCLVQPFIPCMLLEGRGRRTKFWILISHLLFCRLLIFKSEQHQKDFEPAWSNYPSLNEELYMMNLREDFKNYLADFVC